MRFVLIVFAFMLPGVILSCSGQKPPQVKKAVLRATALKHHRFLADKYTPLSVDGYEKKIDYFTIIFDPSASMTEVYEPAYECTACHIKYQEPEAAEDHAFIYGGKAFLDADKNIAQNCTYCHYDLHYSKFDYALSLLKSFNHVIPELDYKGILRTFGSPAYSDLGFGLKENDNSKFETYNKKNFNTAIDRILEADGVSPLFIALEDVKRDFARRPGRYAVIIISDGKGMGKLEIHAVEDLLDKFGEDICIYTVLIGNDQDGSDVLGRLSRIGQGGKSVIGDILLEKQDMEEFVREIFLEQVPADPVKDQDGDGIADCNDDCPETPKGRIVDDNGCWDLVLPADVLFDFNNHDLKPAGVKAMHQVTSLLKRHPFLSVHISGHTDNSGSMAYNIELSKRRALAGYNFLISQGIAPGRILTSWHSYTRPVTSNATAEGRALNRRLELKFTRRPGGVNPNDEN